MASNETTDESYNSSFNSSNNDGKRPQFGNRHLSDPSQVFRHNAWDDVDWDEEREEAAQKKVNENSVITVSDEMQEKYETDANQFWHEFYLQHQNRFFKDRHWLFTEFPELTPQDYSGPVASKLFLEDKIGHDDVGNSDICDEQDLQLTPSETKVIHLSSIDCNLTDYPGKSAHTRIFEVGCGVGNTVFPILQANSDPGVFVYCCDFADSAVELVKSHHDYHESRCHAFQCDITNEDTAFPFPDESLDVIILIFVLSAIRPDRMQDVINTLAKLLKPGGLLLFRDYGRYDMAQLRFKKGRCLGDNFYVRGDGTRVYFFTQEELSRMFQNAGLVEEQNHIDRRLQVNRGRQLKMYRVWVQFKCRKPR